MSEFTKPYVMFAEIEVPMGTIQYTPGEFLKAPRPFLIDYIWIGEECLTVNGAAPPAAIALGTHSSQLGNLTLTWWIGGHGRTTLRRKPPACFDNYMDAERLATAIPGGGLAAVTQGLLFWRFDPPWKYTNGQTFLIDYLYEVGDLGAVGAPIFNAVDLIFHGVGLTTRHRRVFEVQFPQINPALNPLMGSVSQLEFAVNEAAEDFAIHGMEILTAAAWPDLRQLNMMRWRIQPSQDEPFSEEPVPILAYGVEQSPVNRGVWYKPTGGPLLLHENETAGWEIQNTTQAIGGVDIRVQVALIGRMAPTRWRP